MIEQKSISKMKNFMGQFMTPSDLCSSLMNEIQLSNDNLYIEPSFGTGNFLTALKNKGISTENIYGVELDSKLYNKLDIHNYSINNFENKNFYDYHIKSDKKLVFYGNIPFRSPAMSLNTHKNEIKRLCNKYDITGMREEAVFFILKTIDLIENNDEKGEIHYIIPKSILTNNSKFYTKFQNLIKDKFNIKKVVDVPQNLFDNVALDMVFLSLVYDINSSSKNLIDDVDYWKFQNIFKKTYLGSVPCESIFLSSDGESKLEFMNRLIKLYQSGKGDVDKNLRYNGNAHLKVLNGKNEILKSKKIDVIWTYLSQIKKIYDDDFIKFLENIDNYKGINHRKTHRFYFRHKSLKKFKFVYEINPNPCKSFYFTGNPSKSSTDYFGFCDYDITRNSSPGACRTIPVENLETNLTPKFKEWWNINIDKDYMKIFDIIQYTANSDWYKKMKKKYNRFYFGIPKDISFYDKMFS